MSESKSIPSKRRLGKAKDVAAMLECSERTVFRLADEGKIPFGLKLGAMRRWNLDALESWIHDGTEVCSRISRSGERN